MSRPPGGRCEGMPMFSRSVGIDYSGAQTPTAEHEGAQYVAASSIFALFSALN